MSEMTAKITDANGRPVMLIKRSDGPKAGDLEYQERRAVIQLLKSLAAKYPDAVREFVAQQREFN
jgi:hypothetical protein